MSPQPERETMPFTSAAAKFTIGSLDDTSITVSAQYNPAEVQVAQQIGWSQHQKKANESDQALHYEFGARSSREYTVELVFDGVETAGALGKNGSLTVEGEIAKLQKLVDVIVDKPDDADYRPHFCVALWGRGGLPSMSCIIKSLQTKYQRFTPTGRVTRATVTLSISEAYRVDKESKSKHVKAETWRSVRSALEDAADQATMDRMVSNSGKSWIDPRRAAAQAREEEAMTPQQRDARDATNRKPVITDNVGEDNSDR